MGESLLTEKKTAQKNLATSQNWDTSIAESKNEVLRKINSEKVSLYFKEISKNIP